MGEPPAQLLVGISCPASVSCLLPHHKTLLDLASSSLRLPGSSLSRKECAGPSNPWKLPEFSEQAGQGQLCRTLAPKPLGAADSLEQLARHEAGVPSSLHVPLHQ